VALDLLIYLCESKGAPIACCATRRVSQPVSTVTIC